MPSYSRLKKWQVIGLTELEQFMLHVIKTDSCWFWYGLENSQGYVHITINGKKTYGHRKIYELIKGPIPEGKILHHLCSNKACINPEHLLPVTRSTHPGIGVKLGDKRGRYHCKSRFNVRSN